MSCEKERTRGDAEPPLEWSGFATTDGVQGRAVDYMVESRMERITYLTRGNCQEEGSGDGIG